jgi:hypothetical protein
VAFSHPSELLKSDDVEIVLTVTGSVERQKTYIGVSNAEQPDVRSGSKAAVTAANSDFRYTPEADATRTSLEVRFVPTAEVGQSIR